LQNRTIRTIGASVVLAGLFVAGAVQLGAKEDGAPAELAAAEEADSTTAAPGDTESESTTTLPAPFVYRLGVLSGVSTDNYWAYYGAEPSVWNSYILGPTKPALYTIDESGEITPELVRESAAPSWDEEGWRVRVSLDDRYRWSDGEAITAHDFVFTFETVRSLELGGSWAEAFPSSIESIHADGDHDLRIEFAERPNLRMWPYGVGLAPVMPEHVWRDEVAGLDAKGLFALEGEKDVSGGPLAIESISDELVVSHGNDGYPTGTFPDTVRYHVYTDEASLVSALIEGELDAVLTPNGLTEEQAAAAAGEPGVSVLASPANGIRYLGFNLERSPMSEPAYRKALALLLDKEGLSERIPQAADVAWSLVPEANDLWFDPEQAEANRALFQGALEERLSVALEGLVAAGYAWATPPSVGDDGALVAGEGLTIRGQAPQPLTILTPGDEYDPARPEYVARIAETLGILGFDARPVETDFDTVVDLAFTRGDDGRRGYDMYLLGWTLGNPTLPGFYRPFFAADGEMNNTDYQSQEFVRSLAAYEAAVTVEQAKEALWQMEKTLANDLPYLVLYTNRLTEIYRSDRVVFGLDGSLGGLQARLGGIGDVTQVD
jgi:peptide/nickel transport system substrate-binding protein